MCHDNMIESNCTALAVLFKIRSGSMVYHIPPGGYGLTPLGADWFGVDLPGQDDGLYPHIPPGNYLEVLDGVLEDDVEKVVNSFMQKVLDDPEQADSLLSMFESFFDFDE